MTTTPDTYGLPLAHRIRTVLAAAIWDQNTAPGLSHQWMHPRLAEALDVPEWFVNLWGSWITYRKAPWPDTRRLRLNGTSIEVLDNDDKVLAVHPHQGKDATDVDLIAWALYFAAEGLMCADPAIVHAAETLMCQAAGIGDLMTFANEVADIEYRQETTRV